MGIYLKILAFTALVIGFSAFGPVERACATGTPPPSQGGGSSGAIAPQTCDTEVWRGMAARARIETEREIMQNQNLIFKADSVMAYSCFDSMAAHAGANAGILFTHTNYWTPQPIQWGQDGKYRSLDVAVQKSVLDALKTYYEGNFAHPMLGGRGPQVGVSQAHQVNATASSSATYACNVMGTVWSAAKCMNYIHVTAWAAHDGFYPHLTLEPGPGSGTAVTGHADMADTRKYPKPCTAEPIAGSTWTDQYRISRNETAFGSVDRLYQFGTPLNTAYDEVRKRVTPDSCGPAIQTGVTVIPNVGASTTHPDGVCTNPGCTYEKSGTCRAMGGGTGGGSNQQLAPAL